jgi:hypothetical protein
MARASTKDSDLPLFAAETRKFLTVSELNERIKGTLEARLDALWIEGEISNFRVPPSGHFYFTLKDDKSQIAAVMFRRQGAALRFNPENGLAVLCFGRVSLYTVRGDLQLYVDDMEPKGQGALFLAFEQLKKNSLRKVCLPTSASASCRFCRTPLALLPRTRARLSATCCGSSATVIRIAG